MVADNKNTRAAISWIKSFEQGVITWQAVESRILRYMSKYSQKLRDLEDRRLATLHDKILAIRDDPYWTRMWTYQEYQLAKSDPIGMSGRLTFDADLMVTLAEHRSILERWIGRGFRQIFSGRYRQNEIGKLRGLYGSRGRYRDESVLYHFRQTSHRQCKDPRDKVYALYSLLPSLQAQYPPEYKKSSGQVMHETTAYTLRKEGLEILNLFRLLGDRFSTCWTYPSWVLDLTSPTEHESDLFVAYNWWSSHQKLIPAITDDLSTMTIWARCISVRFPVLQLGSTMPDIIKQLVEVADVHNKSWGGLECRLISLMHACLDFSDLEVDFGRDPCTKAKEIFDFLQRIADQGTHSIDDPLWKELCDVFPANAGKTILDIHDSVVKGFAISGPDVRPGDVAVMDSGLPAPLILRPYHDDGELYYRLVDIAYIPLMSKRPRLNGTFDYLRYLERPPQVFSVR
ncbi:hypothetical protein AbraIFM66951_009831 [Aspergillus brasiliensis]|uniref:Heterokaryon incompatibility domain-containing protein n=1 Tax=Aspergillus brasiliensis TaxID=319629 RepID=A0A9W6DLG0_9EURO|nr:hypothetical protein AbraCBS73388_004748 [Aspergillus brasiliensis]GKZ46691.1 hypothetical protein AbraIFM66951_009831 [Aspergillus brasiliensis]